MHPDAPHEVTIRTTRVDDGADTSNHRRVEHLELACSEEEMEVGHFALVVLPDLEVELRRLEAGRPRCLQSQRRTLERFGTNLPRSGWKTAFAEAMVGGE